MTVDQSDSRIFLLSPAHCGGRRAGMLVRDGATMALAVKLREGSLTIGDAFAFMSGLYFRGKLTYARAFARHADTDVRPALVITPTRGLLSLDAIVTVEMLREFARVDIAEHDVRYLVPLERDLAALAARLAPDAAVVLLGSVATGKYVDVLAKWLGGRLRYPSDFVGRGDMSRGGLLLRSAAAREELAYERLSVGVRPRGPRPPKLTALSVGAR